MSIKLVLTDCDGVLTDGGVYYSEGGATLRKFNVRDGRGFELLKQAGFQVGIITSTKDSQATPIILRAQDLNVPVWTGVKDKLMKIKNICTRRNLLLEEVAYLDDDWYEQEALDAVGFSGTVKDFTKGNVFLRADFYSTHPAGKGAFREFADYIISKEGVMNE